MTENTNPTPTDTGTEKRRLPAWVYLMGIGGIAIAGLLALLLLRPPQKSLCEGAAPDWSLALFDDYHGGVEGANLTSADLKGKPVVLNFWASWCVPCAEEAALLEEAWQKYKDQGVVFVGIDYLDQEPSALRYLEKFGITYPNGPDLASVMSKRYTIRGVPETFFINPDGEIVGCRKIGPLTPSELDQRIAEIMP
jgi:cytochrome c biogenesis protein CcmG/thiol:disulfide interchange protein DsbE